VREKHFLKEKRKKKKAPASAKGGRTLQKQRRYK
jgi:hypothetical protein